MAFIYVLSLNIEHNKVHDTQFLQETYNEDLRCRFSAVISNK